jgi:hypothetical protein
VIRAWRDLRPLLDRWRRSAASLHVELRRPRAIDVVPIDFVQGELLPGPSQPSAKSAAPTTRFTGRLIFATRDDITFRRPSGAILVIDNYEIASLSDGHTLFQPR